MKNLSNNQVVVEIQNLGMNGEGVARFNGKVLFIPFALKGEIVLAEIVKNKSNFAIGKIIEILKSSQYRIKPKCPYFMECGGCSLQHLKYNQQLDFKTNLVYETIQKICKISVNVCSCVPSLLDFNYRNKITLYFGLLNNKVILGYYHEKTKNLISIEECYLASSWFKIVIKTIIDFVDSNNIRIYNYLNKTGYLKGVSVKIVGTSIIITFISFSKINLKVNLLVDELINKLKLYKINNVSIFLNVNSKEDTNFLTTENYVIYGNNFVDYNQFGLTNKIGNLSFCQVNNDIKNKLYHSVLEQINNDDFVIDAFSGTGQLSALLATKAKKVIGIEIVKQAWESAEILKKENGLFNLENINGDCEIVLPQLLQNLNLLHKNNYVDAGSRNNQCNNVRDGFFNNYFEVKKDKSVNKNTGNIVLVLDPPRVGVLDNVLKAINKCSQKNNNSLVKINKIIYISCNPVSLAKNLNSLLENFKIEKIVPFDMFPQTSKVETLVILKCR